MYIFENKLTLLYETCWAVDGRDNYEMLNMDISVYTLSAGNKLLK